ncbi:hypothetical protein HYV57_04495 [Candidatus Peregrinibacteria bacterium]|nr:hypothetical protein [Candidatus Peregrinibacteria bacterium]
MDARSTIRLKKMVKRTHIYAFLTLVLLIVTGYLSWMKYTELRTIQLFTHSGLAALEKMAPSVSALDASIQSQKDAYGEKIAQRFEQVKDVFPDNEEFHKLTRKLEKYFYDNNTSTQRMFLNSIDFAKPLVPKIDDQDADYMILPITMGIESSKENFFAFLKFLENSGSFDKKDRLMSLESINFSIPKTDGENPGENTLKVTMKINAYFQKGL